MRPKAQHNYDVKCQSNNYWQRKLFWVERNHSQRNNQKLGFIWHYKQETFHFPIIPFENAIGIWWGCKGFVTMWQHLRAKHLLHLPLWTRAQKINFVTRFIIHTVVVWVFKPGPIMPPETVSTTVDPIKFSVHKWKASMFKTIWNNYIPIWLDFMQRFYLNSKM